VRYVSRNGDETCIQSFGWATLKGDILHLAGVGGRVELQSGSSGNRVGVRGLD